MTYISRDPYARSELHRYNVYTNQNCAWCGQVRKTPKGRTYIYRYVIENDSGHTVEDDHLFCSISCRRSYYEL